MKTSLRKLRGFALHKHDSKDHRHLRSLAQLDELAQATQDLQDMRDCYDSLFSAAAATANSAYELSESLHEIGSCLLQKTALNDDEESGEVLLMLGKVQFELQKLVDSYRSHILQTITTPSESLLNELRTVEEMKQQCDEKRNVYEYIKIRQREKGRPRGGNRETFSMQQLQTARDEYDEEATLFVFRLKSLKQGQSRSLLTQAARHYAAQLCFFRKALKSLESIEPHVKSITEQQHIDYHFSGLEDDDGDGDEDEDEDEDDGKDDVSDDNDDRELSFGFGQNDQEQEVSTSRNSMELDQAELSIPRVSSVEAIKENFDRLRRNSFSFFDRGGSQSAPLFSDSKFDPDEKLRQRPAFARKLHSYVLPTPVDARRSNISGSTNQIPSKTQASLNGRDSNLWHSSPLEQKKSENMGDEKFSGSIHRSSQSVLKECNDNTNSTRLPLPAAEGILFSRNDTFSTSDSKKIKRQSFSGPLASEPWPTKPISVEHVELPSGPLLRNPIPQPLLLSSPKVSPSASPTFLSSPKISELHELPRPPVKSTYKSSGHSTLVGHSAPLGSRGQVTSASNKAVNSYAASPLPTPPQTMARSFSIPSNSARVAAFHISKPLEATRKSILAEDAASPPLTPITLSRNRLSPEGSEAVPQAIQTKGVGACAD